MIKREAEYDHPLSWKALFRIICCVILVFLAWKAVAVFVSILIALIFATAVYPIVKRVNKKFSLLVSTIIVFATFLILVVLSSIFLIPSIVHQLPDLINDFHLVLSRLSFLPYSFKTFNVTVYLNQHASELLTSSKVVIEGIVAIITIFFLTFYFVLDNERFLGFFLDIFPRKEHNKIKGTLMEVGRVNGQYIRGNIIISFICAGTIFIGLFLLGIPYALSLAIFAGIMDLLPLVGSTLGAIPAVIIAFGISPIKGILVLGFHFLYQQTENAIISPAIYNKALNVPPALSFISVIIGAGLFGILGAFLALPVAASIPALLRYMQDYSERNNTTKII